MIRAISYLAFGVVVFVAITFFEQLPVLGWLGGIVSIASWIALTRGLADPGAFDALERTAAVVWATVLGAVTGFVGALTAWLAQTGNLVAISTDPGDRVGAAFGFIGASIGLLYWPLVGALVCAVTALVVAPPDTL